MIHVNNMMHVLLWLRLVAGLDSCAMGHDCQHTCVSSGSSYYCTCPPEFILMEDKKSCFKASDDGDGSTSKFFNVRSR